MKLEQALQYLETTARVSCPQITCDQAREIAELMACIRRDRDWWENDANEAELERWAEIDCGQPDICAKAPGCQKHWALRASELAKERDEARAKLREVEGERNAWFSVYEEAADDRERYAQAACGFAWDAGREMARLDDKAHEFDAELYKAREYINQQARIRAIEIMSEDFDASDYAKPGKR